MSAIYQLVRTVSPPDRVGVHLISPGVVAGHLERLGSRVHRLALHRRHLTLHRGVSWGARCGRGCRWGRRRTGLLGGWRERGPRWSRLFGGRRGRSGGGSGLCGRGCRWGGGGSGLLGHRSRGGGGRWPGGSGWSGRRRRAGGAGRRRRCRQGGARLAMRSGPRLCGRHLKSGFSQLARSRPFAREHESAGRDEQSLADRLHRFSSLRKLCSTYQRTGRRQAGAGVLAGV
jgi:hypothetical protein